MTQTLAGDPQGCAPITHLCSALWGSHVSSGNRSEGALWGSDHTLGPDPQPFTP